MPHPNQFDLTPYLSKHKLDVEDVNDETYESSQSLVLGRLRAAGFPVVEWDTPETTPNPVRTIIAMHIAGTFILATFSEQDVDANSYGVWLIDRSESMLQLLVDGDLALEDVLPVVPGLGGTFESEPMFTVGQVF